MWFGFCKDSRQKLYSQDNAVEDIKRSKNLFSEFNFPFRPPPPRISNGISLNSLIELAHGQIYVYTESDSVGNFETLRRAPALVRGPAYDVTFVYMHDATFAPGLLFDSDRCQSSNCDVTSLTSRAPARLAAKQVREQVLHVNQAV